MISKKMEALVKNSSVIRAMFEEGKRLSDIYGEENVFDFSIGNPNVYPPDEVKEAIIDIVNNEDQNLVHGYMNNAGYEDVRQNIAEFLNKKNNNNLSIENIVMTCGAAGGLNVILKSILNPGEEVIVIAPYFGEYNNYVANYDGKIVAVKADTKTFQPDMYKLEKAINKNTRALIINNPNNPTGVVYTQESIKKMTDILKEKQKEFNTDIYLISDEPYREIVYDGAKVTNLLDYYENTFIGYSYSKSLSLPGERIGYIVVNNEMKDFEDVVSALNVANRILGFVNAPSLFQRVIGKTLGAEVDVNIYKKNRDLLYNHLISIGFECVKPEGAFYLFPKALISDDVKFCEIAKKFNLLLVPGSSFGCSGFVRISYCISYNKIEKSLQAFTKLADYIKENKLS
ncbi:pyridoxal phosphate-dependent aminotransferase [Clostridium sp. HCP1S3_B4]|uniref:pyridoxal phosphate-dependent aminotransferase n=1 Tax=unclassified Clostridium TaxID=2614128 RepID=UPI002A782E5D|nr:pyridoxal phosphate-dependent aminotransferase [Clostridiales bacterium]MDY2729679.1 pyridoxal phosphate-dependent aminotransferase [Clostridium sp.]